MKTLYERLRPEIHRLIGALDAEQRDRITEILDGHVLFTQMKTIDALYLSVHLGLSSDIRLLYQELFRDTRFTI